MSEGKLLPYFFYHMVMKLRPSLQKQHPCKPVPGHHVFKTALGHGDPVFFFRVLAKMTVSILHAGENDVTSSRD